MPWLPRGVRLTRWSRAAPHAPDRPPPWPGREARPGRRQRRGPGRPGVHARVGHHQRAWFMRPPAHRGRRGGDHRMRRAARPAHVRAMGAAVHGRPWQAGAAVRRSATMEAARLLADLVSHEVRTLAFTRSRHGAEAVALAARRSLGDAQVATGAPCGVQRVAAYRSGYLPEDRRQLEEALRTGPDPGARHHHRARARGQHHRPRRGADRGLAGHPRRGLAAGGARRPGGPVGGSGADRPR